MRYVVTNNFTDKFTGEYYSIGETYEIMNDKRARDLERGGYIAPENTDIASQNNQQSQMAQSGQAAQGGQSSQSGQAAQVQQQIQKEVEPYTYVDGKRVPLKEALQAEEIFNENIKTTGITQDHDNSTEPVKAGGIAQNNQQNQAQQAAQQQQQQMQQQAALRTKQSGQQAVGQELQQAQQQVEQQEQQEQQTAQQEAQKAEQQAQQQAQQQGETGGSTVNKSLEQKSQEFNQAAPLSGHDEAAQAAANETKTKAARAKNK
jgi:hypothetical protein